MQLLNIHYLRKTCPFNEHTRFNKFEADIIIAIVEYLELVIHQILNVYSNFLI